MSTEQIYKDYEDRYSSLERDRSVQRVQRTKFKIKRRLGQLENKACFFQGQLNPITIENKALKDKLVQLNKAVSASSDMLRDLISVENNPSKKLKLQIADLEQISAMIKEDWREMEDEISRLKEKLRVKNEKINALQEKLQLTIHNYEQELENSKKQLEATRSFLQNQVNSLKQSLQETERKAKQQKQELIRSYTNKLKEADILKQEFHKYIQDMNQKCSNYEKACQRLRDQIAQNLVDFEKSKENIKELYEGLMQSKLEQQAKQFEYIIKLKEEERAKIVQQMTNAADELKKKISEKNSQINHLSGINDKLKEEMGAIKDQIWQHKIQLDSCHKQLKNLGQKLENEEKAKKGLSERVRQCENQLSQTLQKAEKEKQAYEKQLSSQRSKVKSLEEKLVEQRNIYEKKIQESETKVQEFRRKLRESDQKFKQRLEEQKRRFDEMVSQFQEGKKRLKQEIEQSENKLKLRQKQFAQILSNNELQMRKLQEMHERKLKKMESEYEQTMKRVLAENEQKVKQLTRDYEIKMSEMEISNNEYVRKLVAQQNLKLYEQQTKYKLLQQFTDQKFKSLQDSLDQAISDKKKLQLQCEQIGQKLKRTEEEHKKILEEQRKQSQRLLEQQKQKFKKAMDQKQESYRHQLSQLQQSLQKEISMLKQSNSVDTIEQKYTNMMNKLKEEMELQAKRFQEQKQLALQKATADFNRELSLLSKKLQFDISKLNEDLLLEKQSHEFDKMTREQKINFLVAKINGYRKEMEQKDNKIMQLYFDIEKKNKQLQKIDEIVAERTKKMRYEFEQQLLQTKAQFELDKNNIKSQCQGKVKKVETERIQFTQSLYIQFQDLKAKYDQEMYRLKRRYDELQKIFQERPSRAEDLSKIKELIEEKSKMDLQIKECKKKVKEANEIVKYLNLQLENYKQTYDIFGPGGEPLSPERRVYTETDSPIRSLIRKQTIASEDSSYLKQKRNVAESPDLNQFRLFPPLGRNGSEAVVEQDNESQISQNYMKDHQSSLRKRAEKLQKPMFNSKVEVDDKSQELKSNASIFLGLINRDQKLPIEMKLGNQGYSKRMSRRRTIAVSYDKKLQIKDKTLVLESQGRY